MDEPSITSPAGPLAALIVALTALVGGLLEYLRRKMKTGSGKPTQHDRIEASLQVLVRALVIETEEGGQVARSKRLVESLLSQLSGRLDQIERLLAKRVPQLTRQEAKMEELARNVESLGAAVLSAVELIERHIKEGR